MRLSIAPAGLAALALSVAAGAQASDIKEVHKTLALEKDGRVSIHTFKGSVAVTTWERPEVQVDARIEPGSDDRDDRDKVQWTEVRVSGGGGSVSVNSDYDDVKRHSRGFFGLFDWDSGSLPLIHYKIQMPATARLDIEDHKSDIKVSDLKADLRLDTYKGTARVTNLDGAARVQTHKGDARVEFARYSHASRFETYKGTIELQMPRDSRFELDADSGRHGDVETDFAIMSHAGRSSRGYRASGSVNGGGPDLRMTTTKGTLRIRSK
ncbi:MAG TPA: DUF4097 family beta strand repeat-containing protein [Thermoanaerobaculia bacterium]|nr:DUF4097 family beta strand repeat-containing protein [Thermoanaerobaculia bacterium]